MCVLLTGKCRNLANRDILKMILGRMSELTCGGIFSMGNYKSNTNKCWYKKTNWIFFCLFYDKNVHAKDTFMTIIQAIFDMNCAELLSSLSCSI